MTKEEKAAYDKIYRAKKRAEIAAYKAEWYKRNASRVIEEAKARYTNDPDVRARVNASCREWRRKNKEKASEISARSYIKNKEQKKAYRQKYAEQFPWKLAATCMKRIATKKNATPKWVDTDAIEEIYKSASEITKKTGIPHQVDHIWPLQGVGFVGLHVPWNLRVLPRIENIKKGNKRPDAYC